MLIEELASTRRSVFGECPEEVYFEITDAYVRKVVDKICYFDLNLKIRGLKNAVFNVVKDLI